MLLYEHTRTIKMQNFDMYGEISTINISYEAETQILSTIMENTE